MKSVALSLLLLLCVLNPASAYPSDFFYRISPTGAPLKIEPVSYAPKPDYPIEARRQKLEGTGRFEVHITRDGAVEFVKIMKSTGHEILDRTAVEGLRRWRFRPKSIKVVRVPIQYAMSLSRAHWGSRRDLKEIGDNDAALIIGQPID
jgi:TonB family protein